MSMHLSWISASYSIISWSRCPIDVVDCTWKEDLHSWTTWNSIVDSFLNSEELNASQCGSHFCGVWRDPVIGNLPSIGIPTHREVDSKRPTKAVLWKGFKGIAISNHLPRKKGQRINKHRSNQSGVGNIPRRSRIRRCLYLPEKLYLHTRTPNPYRH